MLKEEGTVSRFRLFASFKMYFGYAQAMSWIEDVAAQVEGWGDAARAAVEVAIFPSFTVLAPASSIVRDAGISLGAQDVAPELDGAQTGEVSAAEIAEIGCRYVELGHAERRERFGDTEAIIAKKVRAAVSVGLVPLLCVGEPELGGADNAARVVTDQLRAALVKVRDDRLTTPLVVAYEPVWAIGKRDPASKEHVRVVIGALRAAVSAEPTITDYAVIYGGSVGPESVADLADVVDGVFLGRYAHDTQDFARIAAAIIETTPS